MIMRWCIVILCVSIHLSRGKCDNKSAHDKSKKSIRNLDYTRETSTSIGEENETKRPTFTKPKKVSNLSQKNLNYRQTSMSKNLRKPMIQNWKVFGIDNNSLHHVTNSRQENKINETLPLNDSHKMDPHQLHGYINESEVNSTTVNVQNTKIQNHKRYVRNSIQYPGQGFNPNRESPDYNDENPNLKEENPNNQNFNAREEAYYPKHASNTPTLIPYEGHLCSICQCDRERKGVTCHFQDMDSHHKNDGHKHLLTIRKESIPPSANSVTFKGFDIIEVSPGTFNDYSFGLNKLTFENIGDLRLTKDSLFFSDRSSTTHRRLLVQFINCFIPIMPSGTILQVKTVSSLSALYIGLLFDNCTIHHMQTMAISNLQLISFHITGSHIHAMEERAIDLKSQLTEPFIIEKSFLPTLVTRAILLDARSHVVFAENNMQRIKTKGIVIMAENSVTFKYNIVEHLEGNALLAIQPKQREGATIIFLNNTVVTADPLSLAIHHNYPFHDRKVINNHFNEPCSCNISLRFQQFIGINIQSSQHENNSFAKVLQESECKVTKQNTFLNIHEYISRECSSLSVPIIASVCAVVALILVALAVLLMTSHYLNKVRAKAEAGDCCSTHSFSTMRSQPPPMSPNSMTGQIFDPNVAGWVQRGNPMWVVGVPDVKTYHETELHVMYENTEPIHSMRGSCQESVLEFPTKGNIPMRASCPFN